MNLRWWSLVGSAGGQWWLEPAVAAAADDDSGLPMKMRWAVSIDRPGGWNGVQIVVNWDDE